MEEDRERGFWYVIQTLSGKENKVCNTLQKQLEHEDDDFPVYEVFIPTEKVTEVRQGKRITTTRKFFPGYILVRMDLYDPETQKLDDKAWYFVRHVQGVIGFIGGNEVPVPLSEKEVEEMMIQVATDEEKAKPKINFEISDNVIIKDGAFANFEGVIQEIDAERGKLKLMVSIFGRSTPVELEFWQVERES